MDNTRTIEYSQYFVAFLDILGFRNLVFSDQDEKINAYFSLIKELTNEIKQIKVKKDIGSITISDSVILSIPMGDSNSDTSIENLRQLCIAIQKIQFKLALNDIWLRGAVSFGDACFNERESQVIGKAYINAYELEQKTAIYPRVVVDSRLIEKFNFTSADELIAGINHHNLYGQRYNATERNILFWWNYNHGQRRSSLANDVPLFIDYLVYAFENPDNLVQVVTSVAKSIYSNNSVYHKYRWVVDYLIVCCEFHRVHGSNTNSPIIDQQLLRLKQL